jgi:sulfate adenylyltransferase
MRELLVDEREARAIRAMARDLPSWDLTDDQLCHIELLMNGGFAPLEGFMGGRDYESVLDSMRLADGTLWPVPITLDVSEACAASAAPGAELALRDHEGVLIALLSVSEIYTPDKRREALAVFGTEDPAHPGVARLLHKTRPAYLAGRVRGVQLPEHYDFKHLRDTPAELRGKFHKLGWRRVIAFHTRQPMHRAQHELTFQAAKAAEANLLIHAATGWTRPGDAEHFARMRCYEHILKKYPEQTTAFSVVPLAALHAGPREALWHAIVRRNHGCTLFMVGTDHASPLAGAGAKRFYGPRAAQDLVAEHEAEIGIEMVPYEELAYVPEKACFLPRSRVPRGTAVEDLTDEEFKRRLHGDLPVPDWFSHPEIIEELRHLHPPRHQQGFTVFFTGLSGAGKSTLAHALAIKLMEGGRRPVTLLDGDIVRRNLSSELGFSKDHRDLNILRIAFVANEITRNGGIAICAPIAPYRRTRREARALISASGGFVEIYVSTPLEVCEARDRKGLYARARAGLIKDFTGVSDPYEAPEHPEVTIDTSAIGPDEAAHRILLSLEKMGYIR